MRRSSKKMTDISNKRKGYLYSLKRAFLEIKEVMELQKRIKTESPLTMATTRKEMEKKLEEHPELLKKAMLTKFKR